KPTAYDSCPAKQRANLFGRCVGGDVEVFGFESDDEVAHGPADDVGHVALLVQNFADLDGVSGHVATVDSMLVTRKALRAARCRCGKEAADKVFYCLF